MNYCLFNAANNGTGGAAIFAGQNIAGKTGTTSSNRDRWFCGYTTHYTAAVWCGYDIPEQIYLTGSSANPAARLWKAVKQPIHDGLPREGLYTGNAFHSVGVCLDSGKKAKLLPIIYPGNFFYLNFVLQGGAANRSEFFFFESES